jgi:DNA-binding transcriptional ArsR family regulator
MQEYAEGSTWSGLRKTGSEAVLANLGTSEVFYCLLKGRSTLTEISEQLRRLQRAGLVKLGAKDGKYQHYEVDPEGLSGLFLNESTRQLHLALTRKTVYPSDKTLKAQLSKQAYWKNLTGGRELDREQMFSHIKARLNGNSSWRNYLIDYLETYTTTTSLGITPILQAARDFENGLRLEVPRILDKLESRTWVQLDESKRELLELLHTWAMLIREVRTRQESAHGSSLRETLGWQIFEELEKRRGAS